MQISRLFGIVYALMERDSLTAGELARRFEVSQRTIYRDIDVLSAAGIPVYADRGKGGGIKLLPGFVLSKSMLTEGEQDEVLSALSGLRATSGPQVHSALGKLSLLFNRERPDWIDVDFGDWSGSDDRFELLKEAILTSRRVAFRYYGGQGAVTNRLVEPLQLWFKHRGWYLRAYDVDKQAHRLFKYTRMRGLELRPEHFERTLQQSPAPDALLPEPHMLHLVMRVRAPQSYRIFDEFSVDQIRMLQDGWFEVCADVPADNWVHSLVLSLGQHAEVLQPQWLREQIRDELQNMLDRYL